MRDEEQVIGVVRGSATRAYPVRLMDFHEVVDDVLDGEAIAVTYCPLCDSAAAFRRKVARGDAEKPTTLTFGVSGYLYESDVLLYDGETESFWQQITGKAVVGPLTGRTLDPIATERTTWEAWKALHPTTTVLSWKTEHRWPLWRYERSPYAEYRRSKRAMFPLATRSDRMGEKELVYGLAVGGGFVAFAAGDLEGESKDAVEVRRDGFALRLRPSVDGGPVVVEWAEVSAEDSRVGRWTTLPTLRCYWFAWYAFHADTVVLDVAAARRLASAAGTAPR